MQRHLPQLYVLGDDGYWHKTPWSLYGSAYCTLPCSPSSTPPDNATDDSGGPPPPPLDDFDLSSLPTGWTSISVDDTSHRGIVVVLALSVALALVIIILMFACIFWRRKHAPKRDPEKRRRRSSDTSNDNSFRGMQEAKATQRKWYRAATRWRDNLRVSAHRRRTNRVLAPATSYSTLTHEERIDGRSSLSHSRPSSPTPTQRSVTPTLSDARSSSVGSIHPSYSPIQTPRILTSTDLPPPSSPPPTQPPAYDPPSSPPESHISPENTYSSCGPSGTLKAPISSHTQSQPADGHLTSHSGHVATDDKAILSLRATLASAPPGSSSNIPQPASVPSMEDEDTFEWPSGSRPSSPSLDEYSYEPHPPYSPPTSLLPPPPSKGKQRFDYYHDLDMSVSLDSAMVEPQLGPSAPPFEECEAVPSAPPLDFDVHVPSAPPMDSEDCPDTTVSGLEDGGAIQPPGNEYEHVVDGTTHA
ncbi:hypothetical protein DFH94DRAFT_407188 [Russula ochroleuca]|uniref:Uncharacterized protein n=1 Tax=Russula ochroleuca TaxID=152965 RepID=A0A9P5MY94_9AGAM|nr:hypothetical protein DFH94DRAFT_407188 [Russula ochroleuca]